MKTFTYVAINGKGATQKGQMVAETANEVAEALQSAELRVVKIDERIIFFDLAQLNQINIGGIPIKEKVVFMRQLATMLSAGISLSSSLEILEQQIENPGFKVAIGKVAKKVSEGVPLSKALEAQKDVFDNITISLIKAGEESGKMEDIFLKLADELEKKQEFQGKVQSAMIYPAIMLVAIVAVVIILMVFMVPTMKNLFASFGSQKLPFATQVVISISDFVVTYWPLLVAIVVGLVFGFRYYYGLETGKKNIDKLLLKIPAWGSFLQKVEIATFTRTMALLIKSGMDIVDILELTSNVINNYWIKKGVLDAMNEVKKGVPLALPISRNEFFPPIVSRMIAVGEEAGKMEAILDKLSDYYDREVKQMTENLSTMIQPIMLIVMGVVVAFIALAVYSPMFALSSVIGGT